MLASSTVTDTLGGSTDASQAFTVSGATGVRTIRRSVHENRVNWGSAIDASIQGPSLTGLPGSTPHDQLAPDVTTLAPPANGMTFAIAFYMLRDCDIVGFNLYKHPSKAGSVPYAMWDATGTLLTSGTVTGWAVDGGGWRYIEFDAPVSVTNGSGYQLGFFTGDNNYVFSTWVWNAQETVVYPFRIPGMSETGSGIRWNASGKFPSTDVPTYPPNVIGSGGTSFWRSPYNFYIDPVAEWEETLPEYNGGTEYFDQFENGGSRFPFPIAVFFADPPNLAGYADLGVNTLMAGEVTDEYVTAVKAADMDWYPYVGTFIKAPAIAVQEDTELAEQVRGYLLDDEPDLTTPYRSPATVEAWRNAIRAIDSTRPVYLGLSYNPVKNQGFFFQPTGATTLAANASFRLFGHMVDIIGCDFYSLAAGDSYSPTVDEINHEPVFNRYGVWAYPPQVRRMQEISDSRIPVWGIIETTSQVPDRPTPDTFLKGAWALLIAGARGLVLFDHRFGSTYVTQDFATILNEEEMGAAVASLSARLYTLGDAMMAPEAGLVADVSSSNTTDGPVGGTYGVPIHYTSRQVDETRYLFAQAIRPGATTGTFVVPDAAGETITVIDESRTLTASSGGVFTDTFAADYTYHLYTWGDVVEGGGATYTDSRSGAIIASGTGTDEYIVGGTVVPIDSDTVIDSDTEFDEGGIIS